MTVPDTPSPWIVRWASAIAPRGTVLDLACGSGRHVRYLAARGLRVTAVDRDRDALVHSQESAAELIEADLERAPWPLPGRRFDAVIVTNYLWRPLMPAIVGSVAEGGLLLYETFALGQEKIGRPTNPDFLLRPGELLSAAQGLRVIAYEDGVAQSPERRLQRLARGAQAALTRGRRRFSPAPQALELQPAAGSTMKPIVGSIVALATPMLDNGDIDYPGLRRLIDWHIAEGTDCIVVVGTTGESPTVTVEEHCEIIRVAVEHARGRVPIMAGAGGNSTHEAIELSRYAKKVGADCTLQVVPYYNRPSQEGIYRHFRAIAEAVDIPLVLYNVPGRTVADMQHDTVLKLAQVDRIVGIKEATGNIERAAWLIKQAPRGFSIYSGDDGTAVALMLLGGHGNVSVTANVAPRLMHELCMAAVDGQARRAAEIHLKLLPLHRQLFCEPSPAPTKWAMARLGLCGAALRLPMVALSAAGQAQVEQALREAGLV